MFLGKPRLFELTALVLMFLNAKEVRGKEENVVRKNAERGKPLPQSGFTFLVQIGRARERIGFGSIVTPKYVLTACRAVSTRANRTAVPDSTKGFWVVAGVRRLAERSPERQQRGAKKFILHPKCGVSWTNGDAALVELDGPLKYTSKVGPMPLFSKNADKAVAELRALQKTEATCLLPEWGQRRLEQAAEVTLVPPGACHRVVCQPQGIKCQWMGANMCLKSKDSGLCPADVGSPLLCGGNVFGMYSMTFGRRVGPCRPGVGVTLASDIRLIVELVNMIGG